MRRPLSAGATLLLAVAMSCGTCGEERHVCRMTLTDGETGATAQGVGVAATASAATEDARASACRGLVHATAEAEEALRGCQEWSRDRIANIEGEAIGWAIYHVCRWDNLDRSDGPIANPADDGERAANTEGMGWRARLREIRDRYVATCAGPTAQASRFQASTECQVKTELGDFFRGCGAFH